MTDRGDGSSNERNSLAPEPAPSLVEFVGAVNIRSLALTGLLLLATAWTLYFAAPLLIPFALAILVNTLLGPAVRGLARWRIPAPLSAAVLMAGLVVLLGTAVNFLAEPAREWIREAPTSIREMRERAVPAKDTLENIQEISDEVGDLGKLEKKPEVQQVKVEEPDILENLLEKLPGTLAMSVVFFFLSFFFLASGDSLMRKVAALGRTITARKQILIIAQQVQDKISRYLATITLINIVLGISTGVVMWLLEVPNPVLWGVMAGVLNFAPYVGAIVSASILALVGITAFESLSHALMVPGAFLLLTILEGQLFTPLVVGRNLSLSPTVVFASVIVWGWMWGVIGALIAVPLVASLKVICEHVPPLKPLSEMMER